MKAVSWAAGVELNYTKKRQRFYYVFTFLTYFYFYLNVFTPMVAPGRSRRVGAKQPQQNILRLTNTKISTLKFAGCIGVTSYGALGHVPPWSLDM